ncbi:hypothetical protein [Actinospica robiniae]|nr:hypothetical protein [Actinospica robiniae]
MAHGTEMRTVVDGEVFVHYGQIYVNSDPDSFGPELKAAFAGQSVGLCGGADPGALWLVTGLHTGNVGFTVEVHDQPPLLDPAWEEAVEVSFRPASGRSLLVQWAGSAAWELGLDEIDYRVRYCAQGMEGARLKDTRTHGPQLDRYLLQFWPAPPEPERLLRRTSSVAEYWHEFARKQPPPPTAAERAEAERVARETQEQADEQARTAREEWKWGGKLPSERLRQVSGCVESLLRFDPELVHALDAAGPAAQRSVALLAARRACEAAGLAGVGWIAAALDALEAGDALPPPFDDRDRLHRAIRADPDLPRQTVGRAIPPQRPAFQPPLPSRAGRGEPLRLSTSSRRPAPAPAIRISQRHMALPAVVHAAEADPLEAAVKAVSAAVSAYGENYPALLAEVRATVRPE